MVDWELGEDELVGLGVSIGKLTKRNMLTVWIFVIEGVVVIEVEWRKLEELELA